METITVEIGRDRVHRIAFTVDGEPVNDDALTKAVLRFGEYCLDTEEGGGLTFVESKTAVDVELGLVEGLTKGAYVGHLTAMDGLHENGLPFGQVIINAINWPVCPEAEPAP